MARIYVVVSICLLLFGANGGVMGSSRSAVIRYSGWLECRSEGGNGDEGGSEATATAADTASAKENSKRTRIILLASGLAVLLVIGGILLTMGPEPYPE